MDPDADLQTKGIATVDAANKGAAKPEPKAEPTKPNPKVRSSGGCKSLKATCEAF
jgi:hypothetical protein